MRLLAGTNLACWAFALIEQLGHITLIDITPCLHLPVILCLRLMFILLYMYIRSVGIPRLPVQGDHERPLESHEAESPLSPNKE